MTRTRSAWLALPLALALVLTTAACGDDEPGRAAAGDPGGPTTEATAETTAADAPAHEGPIAVVGAEFRFEGVPARVAAGPHDVTFENRGTETHELFLFRNPDGLSLHEIAALGPEGADEAVELATPVVYVGPGEVSDPVEVDLAPGEYVLACFIPTPVDDRAHFEHGMEATFTVE